MSKIFGRCVHCKDALYEPGFTSCLRCAGKPATAPISTPGSITATGRVTDADEALALESLAEIAMSDEVRLRRIWLSHRLSLRRRSFGALARPQPR